MSFQGERRVLWRRDVNELVRDADGHMSEAKLWANIGKGMAVYLLYEYGATVVANWEVLAVLLVILVAPDLLKKMLTMKYGGATSNGNGAPKDARPPV